MALSPQLEDDHMAKISLESTESHSGITAYVTLDQKYTTVQLNRLWCDAPEAMKQLLEMAHSEYQSRR